MHSPDPKALLLRKTTSLKDKKNLSVHLFKGSFLGSPRSATGNYSMTTCTTTTPVPANRFEQNSKTFIKTNNPQLEFQIRYDHKTKKGPLYRAMPTTQNTIESSSLANALLSPRYSKRNPILQDNDEPTQAWRSTARLTTASHKTTIFTAEEPVRARAKGQFNDNSRPLQSEIPEPKAGIRVFNHSASKSFYEVQKRQLTDVATSPEKRRTNPLTEGEAPAEVRQRNIEQQISSATQKVNERRSVLPSDRVVHSPLRSSQQKPSELKMLFEQGLSPRASSSQSFYMSEELCRKKTGTMQQVIDQSAVSDSKFKAIGKCNEVAYGDIRNSLNTDKTYARTKVDLHP